MRSARTSSSRSDTKEPTWARVRETTSAPAHKRDRDTYEGQEWTVDRRDLTLVS